MKTQSGKCRRQHFVCACVCVFVIVHVCVCVEEEEKEGEIMEEFRWVAVVFVYRWCCGSGAALAGP